MKIAIIDTGIEIGHPAFSDAGLAAPAGYPKADSPADLPFTNNKVIVARSYANYFSAADPDRTAADHVGHGTATAMAAAGSTNTGPLATITGVAPRAYLGVYKVFGTPGINDGAPEDAILTAIEIGALYVPGLPKHVLVTLILIFGTMKFALVVAFFMHLRYDNKLLTVLFVGPLLIATGIILAIMALFGAYLLLARG